MFAEKTMKEKMKNKLTIIIPLLMLGALVGGCDSSTSKETYIYGPCKFCHKPGYARGKWADAQEMVDNGDKRALCYLVCYDCRVKNHMPLEIESDQKQPTPNNNALGGGSK